MREPGLYVWRNPWFRWSVLSVGATTVAAMLVGFLWLPSVQSDFSAQGIWASICRAAGVPAPWSESGSQPSAALSRRSTLVVLDAAMAQPAAGAAAGQGATLALQQCTMCHGARGVSEANAPNLAGQHAEVIIKQLKDYQQGDRTSSVMQAMVRNLTEQDIIGLAAYYAALPKAPSVPHSEGDAVPQLVSVGDPMRNIAACASCHSTATHKLGAPWLEGMPQDYLAAQLTAFAAGQRTNDSHAQMRNMARRLTAAEVTELAGFYARR